MSSAQSYMVIDESMFGSYQGIISDYIGMAIDFAFPIFRAIAGIVLFVFIVIKIYHWIH